MVAKVNRARALVIEEFVHLRLEYQSNDDNKLDSQWQRGLLSEEKHQSRLGHQRNTGSANLAGASRGFVCNGGCSMLPEQRAARIAPCRGGQQVLTDEFWLMAISTVAVDENTCVISGSHGPSQ